MRLIDKIRSSFNLGTMDDFHGYAQEVVIQGGNVYPLNGNGTIINHNGAAPVAIDDMADAAEYSSVVDTALAKRSGLASMIYPVWGREDGSTFTDQSLDPIQNPDMVEMARFFRLVEHHDSLFGGAYAWRGPDGIRLVHPQRLEALIATRADIPTDDHDFGWMEDAEIIGWLYMDSRGRVTRRFAASEIAPLITNPDPKAWWRGRSWVTSVLRDIKNDGQATTYISNFLKNDGTPSMVVKFDPNTTPSKAKEFRELFEAEHVGAVNAGKTLFLGGAADISVVGSKLGELALREVVGQHENRIVSRSEVPAVIMGTREGMQGSALNAGNYAMTRRQWADSWFSPWANSILSSLERLLDKPDRSLRLTYDKTRIPFLEEDQLDAATIRSTDAATITQLVRDGYTPESAAKFVETGRASVLKHTGLLSVQLQDPNEKPEQVVAEREPTTPTKELES